MKHLPSVSMSRLLALVLALLLTFGAVLAEEVNEDMLMDEEEAIFASSDYSANEALDEEATRDALELQPGEYEWYILPTDPIDGRAYVDIFPSDLILYGDDGSWTYYFTLEEVWGIAFQPYIVTIICFTGDQEVSREINDMDTIASWWRDGGLLCGSSVVYEGRVTDQDVTAVAISVIGLEEGGYEQEFHSIIDIRERQANAQ